MIVHFSVGIPVAADSVFTSGTYIAGRQLADLGVLASRLASFDELLNVMVLCRNKFLKILSSYTSVVKLSRCCFICDHCNHLQRDAHSCFRASGAQECQLAIIERNPANQPQSYTIESKSAGVSMRDCVMTSARQRRSLELGLKTTLGNRSFSIQLSCSR